MLVKTIHVGPIGTNCYLLGDEDAGVCAVVDPGDEAPRVLQMIGESGLKPELILLTHGHYDHVTAVPELRAAYPAVPIYIHEEDYDSARTGVMHRMAPTTNVIFCREGDVLKLGNLAVEVLHTPGHTPGSVTFKVGSVLFTGDTLFQGSMGRTDFPGGSYEAIMASLKKLGSLPGDYRVCPGHEGLSTLEEERRGNYYMREAMGG
ncbi:MAG: MBL fold metallo-hydrolase [Clostridia bacterium]|nr:MBL fold metallo-hydrolase [Clostridia bacterium]